MKITLEHYDIKSTIETEHDDLAVPDVLKDLVIPLLVGAGFDRKGIEDTMAEYCDCGCDCNSGGEKLCLDCGYRVKECVCFD